MTISTLMRRRRDGHSWLLTPALALTLVLTSVAAVVPAAAAGPSSNPVIYRGSILVAHPFMPVTMIDAACNPHSPLNGVDGVWFKVPGGRHHVTMYPSGLLEADVFFYSEGRGGTPTDGDFVPAGACRSVGRPLLSTHLGDVLSGPLPRRASYVYVNGFLYSGSVWVLFS